MTQTYTRTYQSIEHLYYIVFITVTKKVYVPLIKKPCSLKETDARWLTLPFYNWQTSN